MMKNKVYTVAVGLVMMLTVGSCKKEYFDINKNLNKPTEESITPDLLLPQILNTTANRMATSYASTGRWMGYWTRSGTYGPNPEEESYNITTTFEATEWSGWYQVLFDASVMEKKAAESGMTMYEGIAKVMKVIGFMYLVDQYDNVPYSRAFNIGENILTPYDKGSDIYNDFFVQLDSALADIKDATADENKGIEAADIMFGGDTESWRKFINTLRLKLALRLSQVSSFDPSAQIAKITADGSGFINTGETASVNPGYVIDNNKQNPFWDSYKLTYTGAIVDNFNRANNYVLGLYMDNDDIRYQYFFDAAESPIGGNDYYGYNYGENIPNTSPQAVNSSGVGGPGLAVSPTQNQWVITSVESLFMQAEAIQRKWLPGDAELAYRAAVTESFVWLGVEDAETTATTYLDQSNPLISWGLANSDVEKINLIAMQQYLALCGINNFEAWTLYRRLGVPASLPQSLSPSRGSNHIPYRLRYPQDEYNYNTKNVDAEGAIDPQTKKVFWDN